LPVAFVTGAGVRVGAAIADALGDAGYDLILHAHRSADAARAKRKGIVLTADLSIPEEVDRLAAEVRRAAPVLDVIVHNAGIFEKTPFAKIDRAAWRRMQAINLDAPAFLTQALLPSLEAAPAPVVIHLADVVGERPMRQYAHYAVSKAALVMLTRALAIELGPKIRVNAVAPGTVAWPPGFDPAARERIVSRIALGREGTVEDVAKAVLYLVRDAPYVTGVVLPIDGGRSALL
jgi:pteridine reductase